MNKLVRNKSMDQPPVGICSEYEVISALVDFLATLHSCWAEDFGISGNVLDVYSAFRCPASSLSFVPVTFLTDYSLHLYVLIALCSCSYRILFPTIYFWVHLLCYQIFCLADLILPPFSVLVLHCILHLLIPQLFLMPCEQCQFSTRRC